MVWKPPRKPDGEPSLERLRVEAAQDASPLTVSGSSAEAAFGGELDSNLREKVGHFHGSQHIRTFRRSCRIERPVSGADRSETDCKPRRQCEPSLSRFGFGFPELIRWFLTVTMRLVRVHRQFQDGSVQQAVPAQVVVMDADDSSDGFFFEREREEDERNSQ